MPELHETLHALCTNETGAVRPKDECRALMINHLILEEGMGVDEAEDTAEAALRKTGYWPMPNFFADDDASTELSTATSLDDAPSA